MKREFVTEKGRKITVVTDGSDRKNIKTSLEGKTVRVCFFTREEMEDLAADPEEFKNNIKKIAGQEPPFSWLLWPSDFFEGTEGTFGYITDLIPSEFISLENYMNGSRKFKSWSVSCAAALELVWIFYSLHKKGYCFMNMTNEDVLINGNTGRVLLTGAEWLRDLENIKWTRGREVSVLVHPLYYLGKKQPDLITDEYLLSVLLFEILCLQHPLEGHEVARCPILNDTGLNKFYGTDPLFIFDRENDSNRPVRGVHLSVSRLWDYCPEYIKMNFYHAFSQTVMTNNTEGVSAALWYRTLDFVRSSVFPGPDGTEKILAGWIGKRTEGQEEKQKEIEETAPLSWETGEREKNRRFFLIPGNRIYMSQMDPGVLSDPSEVAGEIARGENAKLCYILNKTQQQWTAQYEDTQFLVKPGETLPVKAGMSVQIGKNEIRITETKVTG